MSLLRPKDDDYITRGLFLLVTWFLVGWLPFAVVGALLAGAGGAAVGLVLSIPLGIWGYSTYLNWGLRNIAKKSVDEFAELIAVRRINRGLPRG